MNEATLVVKLTTDANRIEMAMEHDNVLALLRERQNDLICTVDYSSVDED